MGVKGSAEGFGANRPDHLHPEGSKWALKGQQQDLQQIDQITYTLQGGDGYMSKVQQHDLLQTDQITYKLRAADGHQRVSSRIHGKQTMSLTN